MKKIFKFFITVLFIYVLFVTVECIRLNKSNAFTKPLIIFNSESSNEELYFTGLGYKVKYKIKRERKSSDLELVSALESEFILFDTFTLWTKKYNNE